MKTLIAFTAAGMMVAGASCADASVPTAGGDATQPAGSMVATDHSVAAAGSAAVATSASPRAEAGGRVFVMPNVLGKNLQDAQDQLQTLGSFRMDQQDASGQKRMQILDTNWRVCSQWPAPGTRTPSRTRVVLRAVKLKERCPR